MITKTTISPDITVSHGSLAPSKVGSPTPTWGTTFPAASMVYSPYGESITSEKGGKGTFKHCDHTKVTRFAQLSRPFRSEEDGSDSSRYVEWAHVPADSYTAIKNSLNANGCAESSLSEVDIADYATKALQAMYPRIEAATGESAVNFGIEIPSLRRIPDVVKQLRWIFGNPRSTALFFKTTRDLVIVRTKQLTRWSASANLTYQYGIAPLVSDILGITQAMLEFRKRVKQIYHNRSRVLTSHHRARIAEFEDHDGSSGAQAAYGYIHHRKRIKTIEEAWFHTTMTYKYQLAGLPNSLASLFAFIDTFGLNFNLKTVWNATRYSFLIDWFLRIGDYLDQFKEGALEPTVYIRSFGCSVKWKETLQYSNEVTAAVSGHTTGEWIVLREIHERYHRFRYVPSFYRDLSKFVGSGLDLNKIGLAASLYLGR